MTRKNLLLAAPAVLGAMMLWWAAAAGLPAREAGSQKKARPPSGPSAPRPAQSLPAAVPAAAGACVAAQEDAASRSSATGWAGWKTKCAGWRLAATCWRRRTASWRKRPLRLARARARGGGPAGVFAFAGAARPVGGGPEPVLGEG